VCKHNENIWKTCRLCSLRRKQEQLAYQLPKQCEDLQAYRHTSAVLWYGQEHPIKCHKWQREGSRSIHLLILNWRQTGVCGQGHAPAALPPGKSAGTYCTRGWVSPRPVCKALEKKEFPVPTTVWSPDRPARSQSLHWVRYPDPYPLVYSSQRVAISFKSCFIAQPCNRTYFSAFYTINMLVCVPPRLPDWHLSIFS